MKVIVDKKIPYLQGVIERLADEVVYAEGRDFTPELVRDADALFVRTRTRCDRALLAGSRVRFIATATIGFDHIDTDFCRASGITWTNAPGCNAGGVEQYVESALLLLERERGFSLRGACLGVIAVMFFGWRKVSRGFHLTATWLTAFGANLSAWWILVANSWMQYPVGCDFNLETVRNEMTSFSAVALSPVAVNKFFHTVTSSFVLAALFVVGVSAWYLLRRREQLMARRSIAIASAFGFVFALVTAFTGDRSGAIVARVQPMKLAAMEALYDGQQGAPLTAVGILRPEAQRTGGDAFYFRIDIPKMLSLMSFRSADAFVPGINDLVYGNEEYGVMPASEKIERGRVAVEELGRYRTAREKGDTAAITEIEAKFDRSTPQGAEFLREHFAYFGYGYLSSPEQIVPDVPLLFYSFRVMVGAGCFFILLLGLVWWLNRKDRLADKRWLLWIAVWSVPLAYLASQAGWVLAEVGRQPWAIQDLMPVGIAASKIGSTSVTATFFIFLALFTALLIAELSILFRQIKIGPEQEKE